MTPGGDLGTVKLSLINKVSNWKSENPGEERTCRC